ncbi:MAG TPA: hypothetical protein VGM53_23490 [Streptosporangiaceae bacterium]|jgi:hypothetical protein
MAAAQLATWMLEREARAMLARLDRVKPFAVQETMLPAAALSPAAQAGIENYLINGRRTLRRQIRRYIEWLRGAGSGASPAEQQKRFTFLRLRFNQALSQLDMFSDAITQRSENETGLWLSGLDIAAQDALDLPGGFFRAPPVVCYLHRGLGGAIRRARTRLPGGGENPVSIIRIPRERMIGYGIASSLVHETGHQAAALLGLVQSLRPEIQQARRRAPGPERVAWRLWERWISEIVADLYSIARAGVSSTMGLVGLVSLPRAFVFRMAADDPHPSAWIRVHLSCAFGNALYPDPQWRQLAGVWTSFYPAAGLPANGQRVLRALLTTMPAFVHLVLGHRPAPLRGHSLGAVLRSGDRTPAELIRLYRAWAADPQMIRATRPALAFAVVGQARANGLLTPEAEDRLLGRLISYWALDSTLQANARLAAALPAPYQPQPYQRTRGSRLFARTVPAAAIPADRMPEYQTVSKE